MQASTAEHVDEVASEAGVVIRAAIRASDLLGLSAAALAQIIGTSEASVSRIGNHR